MLKVLGWFGANILLLVSNKVMMTGYFTLPVALTVSHMLASLFYTTIITELGLVPKQGIASRQQLLRVALLSGAFSLSIVAGVGCECPRSAHANAPRFVMGDELRRQAF